MDILYQNLARNANPPKNEKSEGDKDKKKDNKKEKKEKKNKKESKVKPVNKEKGNYDDLINGNLKLVLSLLKKFNNKVDNLDDLFQVGCLGLVKAIDNFDTSYNVTLSTYACPIAFD